MAPAACSPAGAICSGASSWAAAPPLPESETAERTTPGAAKPGYSLPAGLLIVLGNPLAHFAGGHAHDGIQRGIVIGVLAEDFDADGPLLQLVPLAVYSGPDDIPEEGREAPAMAEVGSGQQALELRQDGKLLLVARGFREHLRIPRRWP